MTGLGSDREKGKGSGEGEEEEKEEKKKGLYALNPYSRFLPRWSHPGISLSEASFPNKSLIAMLLGLALAFRISVESFLALEDAAFVRPQRCPPPLLAGRESPSIPCIPLARYLTPERRIPPPPAFDTLTMHETP